MGFVVWLAGGVIAVIVARIIPFRPKPPIRGDVLVSAFAAVGAGVLATALDFGGWNEADWRAGVFSLLLAFAALGIRRMTENQKPETRNQKPETRNQKSDNSFWF